MKLIRDTLTAVLRIPLMIYRDADHYMEQRPSWNASSRIEHVRPAELKTGPCQLW